MFFLIFVFFLIFDFLLFLIIFPVFVTCVSFHFFLVFFSCLRFFSVSSFLGSAGRVTRVTVGRDTDQPTKVFEFVKSEPNWWKEGWPG